MTCVWRKLWPKFGRLFNYGHVDITNIVERHNLAVYHVYCFERKNKPIYYRYCACLNRG